MLLKWKPAAIVLTLVLVGCGRGGPKTHPVRGYLLLSGGDIAHLAGSHIEAALTTEPTVRASGIIQEDGSFKLETLHAGATVAGAREGKYEVRIVLPDDDRETRRRASQAIAPRFLQFKTSGLTLDVPTTGDVTLAVTAR